MGRLFGVTKMVMMRPRRESWWVRSRSGSMWPWAGYGNTRMCVAEVEDMMRLELRVEREKRLWSSRTRNRSCDLSFNSFYLSVEYIILYLSSPLLQFLSKLLSFSLSLSFSHPSLKLVSRRNRSPLAGAEEIGFSPRRSPAISFGIACDMDPVWGSIPPFLREFN